VIYIKKLIVIFVIFALLAIYVVKSLNGVESAAEGYASMLLKSSATQNLYSSLYKTASLFDVTNLIKTEKAGENTVLHVDSYLANQMLLELVKSANDNLSKSDFCSIDIPLGNIIGSRVLSGLGPKVNIKTVPVGYAVGNIKSDIVSAGINQSKYRLIATVCASVGLLYPYDNCISDISVDVIICETVIIGSVPKIVWSRELAGNLE